VRHLLQLFALLLFSCNINAGSLWRWSVAALAAGNAADIASTIGQTERNPMLGPSMNVRAVSIKVGIAAGSVAFQAIIEHKRPRAEKAFSAANFATSSALAGLAARNWKASGRK